MKLVVTTSVAASVLAPNLASAIRLEADPGPMTVGSLSVRLASLDEQLNDVTRLVPEARTLVDAVTRMDRRDRGRIAELVHQGDRRDGPSPRGVARSTRRIVLGDEVGRQLLASAGSETALRRMDAQLERAAFELGAARLALRGSLAEARVVVARHPGEAPIDLVVHIGGRVGRAEVLRVDVIRLLADSRVVQGHLRARRAELLRTWGSWIPSTALGPIQRSHRTGSAFLACPVDPPRTITDDFGDPRYGGGYHPHQGNDIMAPLETAIRAPFDGTAEPTWSVLGGRAVVVRGDEGYVYNAHLSSYGMLGPVAAGSVIGFVGTSGNATLPHDHFEWHPSGDGAAVDPYADLLAVC